MLVTLEGSPKRAATDRGTAFQASPGRREDSGVRRPWRTYRRFFENWIVRASTHTARQPVGVPQGAPGGRQRVSAWSRRIGRPELSVRAKATGGKPRHIKRIEQRRSQIGLALKGLPERESAKASTFNMRV